ncbi:AGAP005094-PA-like protein [Anopheles sinensis]|uniref:AGAP005094-PA-like protein n=1 Tax=Anopheles sinensis TaxID=74873 RepID=A0A084W2I8_ANOSI|nr:AGAP005094-PA-like protein [Anopheles sinensis]
MYRAIVFAFLVSTVSSAKGATTFQQYIELMFQFDAVFEQLCLEKTNDTGEAQRMVAANVALQDCVNRHHDPQNFTNSLDALTEENRKEFIHYNCEQFEEIKKCYVPFARQLERCFEPQDVTMAKTLILLEQEFAFICEADGANVVPLGQSNYSYCAGNLQELLQNCSTTDWHQLRRKTIATLTDNDCSIFHSLAICFQQNINKCGAPLFAKLFDIRYRAIVRQTMCGKGEGNAS